MGAGDLFRKRATDLMREASNETLAKAARTLEENVVDRTPELSGKAKHGWEFDKAPESVDFFGGETATLRNREPHIRKLERGSSDQAPRGMLAVSAAEFPGVVKDAARRRGGK